MVTIVGQIEKKTQQRVVTLFRERTDAILDLVKKQHDY
jgi:hypothetical protein